MGLKPHDLEDLVSNLISIDEFESKIDNNKCIVVAFKVTDKEPAEDLSRFIEKSTVDVTDTEVSPAPDTDGKYIVFVEFSRNTEFAKKLLTILNTLENLTDIHANNYRYTAYKVDGEHPVSEESLNDNLKLNTIEQEQLVDSFFNTSVVDDILFENNQITLIKYNNIQKYKFIDIGPADLLFNKYKLNNTPFNLTESARWISRDLSNILGAGYVANVIKNYILLSKENTNTVVILKNNS
ncbi:MAG: hypothetical protein HC836_46120 [Richelia sp. RM2_1_2]|nr:hypothetical protein [Richelia sp. RM2_1_2]